MHSTRRCAATIPCDRKALELHGLRRVVGGGGQNQNGPARRKDEGINFGFSLFILAEFCNREVMQACQRG